MSRPRAATSVATRIGTRPPLNESITPSRWPWRHVAVQRADVHAAVAQLAVELVACGSSCATKTIAWSGRSAASTSTSLSALSAGLTSSAELLDGVDGQVRRLDLDVRPGRRGSGRPARGSAAASSRRTAPSGGCWASCLRIFSTSSRKPRSSISSASSRTTKRQSCRISDARWTRSMHAADGADDDVAAGAQLRLLGADRRAAEDGDDVDALARAVRAQRLRDLDAELARRREDERLDLRRRPGSTCSSDRQAERRRLARARSAPGR